MAKKNKQPPASMVPPTMNSTMGVGTGAPMTQSLPKKSKGGKKGRTSAGMTHEQTLAMQTMSPEQMTQLQLEEAIKESQNPAMRLKKLKSPLSIKGCLINILFFVILTMGIALLLVWIYPPSRVDKYHIGVIFVDLFDKSGITGFFRNIGDWFAGLGKGKGEAAEILLRNII